jgi:uncharacterized Tic20 family protein
MNVALLALAFLCGVPFGVILGVIVLWRMNAPDQDDIDYSGGV